MTDDYFRYIEYLQGAQITEGWDEFFRSETENLDPATVEWLLTTVAPTLPETDETILEMARGMLLTPVVQTTRFEGRLTEIRYRPILNEIIEAAKDLGLSPLRPIDIVTSTNISCSPMARPTDDRHILFAGEGSARFCNYWTKAISRVFYTIKRLPEGLTQDEWDRAILSAQPSGVGLGALFAVKYAFEGTMLGFYRVPNIPEETEWRASLLRSMFLFLVAHEYAHFVSHEKDPGDQSALSEAESQTLELWCDQLAIKLCIQIGRKKDRIHVRAGLGALAFFRVLQICHAVKDLYVAAGRLSGARLSNNHLDSHPVLNLRVDALVAELLESEAPEEKESVRLNVDGLLSMLDIMRRLTITVVEQALKVDRRNSSVPA